MGILPVRAHSTKDWARNSTSQLQAHFGIVLTANFKSCILVAADSFGSLTVKFFMPRV